MAPSHTETAYTFCIQKLYKMHTTGIYKMYTECMQNVYHILTNFWIHFGNKIKRTMPAKFCFVKMRDTFCIQTYCIHLVCINSDLQKMCIINIMYTICIQNSYIMYIEIIVCRMNPLFQHILTHLLCTSLLFIANNWAKDLKIAG